MELRSAAWEAAGPPWEVLRTRGVACGNLGLAFGELWPLRVLGDALRASGGACGANTSKAASSRSSSDLL